MLMLGMASCLATVRRPPISTYMKGIDGIDYSFLPSPGGNFFIYFFLDCIYLCLLKLKLLYCLYLNPFLMASLEYEHAASNIPAN